MSCGWEGNRRSGIALAMRHRLQWFIHLQAHGLDGEMSSCTPHGVWHSFTFFFRDRDKKLSELIMTFWREKKAVVCHLCDNKNLIDFDLSYWNSKYCRIHLNIVNKKGMWVGGPYLFVWCRAAEWVVAENGVEAAHHTGIVWRLFVSVDQDTFVRAKSWVKELQRQASPNIVIALAGNKSDLADKRLVETEVCEACALLHSCSHPTH